MSNKKEGPYLSGTHTAYRAEFLEDGKWKVIPTGKRPNVPGLNGVPAPAVHGKANDIVGVMGFHQALAIAHWFLADFESDLYGPAKRPKVRIQGYDLKFEVRTTLNGVMTVNDQFIADEQENSDE